MSYFKVLVQSSFYQAALTLALMLAFSSSDAAAVPPQKPSTDLCHHLLSDADPEQVLTLVLEKLAWSTENLDQGVIRRHSGNTVRVEDGLTSLVIGTYLEEISHKVTQFAQRPISILVRTWKKAEIAKFEEARREAQKTDREAQLELLEDGRYLSHFINHYEAFFYQRAEETGYSFRGQELSRQEGWLIDQLTRHTETKATQLQKQFSQRLRSRVKELTALEEDAILEKDQEEGSTATSTYMKPNIEGIENAVSEIYSLSITEILTELKIDILEAESKGYLKKEVDLRHLGLTIPKGTLPRVVSRGTDGVFRLKLSSPKIAGHYEKAIGTTLLYPGGEQGMFPHPKGITLVLLHGSGTSISNAGSWINMIPLLTQMGFNPIAVDLAGSMGKNGLAPSGLNTPAEHAVYLDLVHDFLRSRSPEAPLLIDLGRSSGSTFALLSYVYAKLSGRKPTMDLVQGTSLSNPKTADDQIQNVVEEIKNNPGDIRGFLPEVLIELKDLWEEIDLQLEADLEAQPGLFDSIGHEVLLQQGENDLDGAPRDPNGPSVIEALQAYRDRFLPTAGLRRYDDPLRPHKEQGLLSEDALKSLNESSTEGSHFLLSSRSNITRTKQPEIRNKLNQVKVDLNRLIVATQDYRKSLNEVAKSIRLDMSETQINPHAMALQLVEQLNEALPAGEVTYLDLKSLLGELRKQYSEQRSRVLARIKTVEKKQKEKQGTSTSDEKQKVKNAFRSQGEPILTLIKRIEKEISSVIKLTQTEASMRVAVNQILPDGIVAEEDLPKLEDQTQEVFFDLLIRLDWLASKSETIQDHRRGLTDSDDPHAYLRWRIDALNANYLKKRREDLVISLEEVLSPDSNIPPGRATPSQRVRRAWLAHLIDLERIGEVK